MGSSRTACLNTRRYRHQAPYMMYCHIHSRSTDRREQHTALYRNYSQMAAARARRRPPGRSIAAAPGTLMPFAGYCCRRRRRLRCLLRCWRVACSAHAFLACSSCADDAGHEQAAQPGRRSSARRSWWRLRSPPRMKRWPPRMKCWRRQGHRPC
jgi:hypothetical protein